MDHIHIRVTPLTPSVGAMIDGVDLNNVGDNAAYDDIAEALTAHHVVFFRNQKLTPDAHLRLGRRFGKPNIADKSLHNSLRDQDTNTRIESIG